MHVFGDGDRAERHVLDRAPRSERRPAGRDLNDSVGLALGQSAQDGIRGRQ